MGLSAHDSLPPFQQPAVACWKQGGQGVSRYVTTTLTTPASSASLGRPQFPRWPKGRLDLSFVPSGSWREQTGPSSPPPFPSLRAGMRAALFLGHTAPGGVQVGDPPSRLPGAEVCRDAGLPGVTCTARQDDFPPSYTSREGKKRFLADVQAHPSPPTTPGGR